MFCKLQISLIECLSWLYLQADGQVDPAAEGGADGPRVEAQIFEELREGVCEGHPGPFLCHHHTGPNSGQIQTSSLGKKQENVIITSDQISCVWMQIYRKNYLFFVFAFNKVEVTTKSDLAHLMHGVTKIC